MAVRLDPFQNIVNVSWNGALAAIVVTVERALEAGWDDFVQHSLFGLVQPGVSGSNLFQQTASRPGTTSYPTEYRVGADWFDGVMLVSPGTADATRDTGDGSVFAVSTMLLLDRVHALFPEMENIGMSIIHGHSSGTLVPTPDRTINVKVDLYSRPSQATPSDLTSQVLTAYQNLEVHAPSGTATRLLNRALADPIGHFAKVTEYSAMVTVPWSGRLDTVSVNIRTGALTTTF